MARDYAATIKNLLTKAQHPSTPRAEAEAAAARAAELMTRYGIEETQLREKAGRDPEEITILKIRLPKGHGTVLFEAVMPMIRAMGARPIKSDGLLQIVGTGSLLSNIEVLITCLELQMVNASNAAGDRWEDELRATHPRWSDDQIGDAVDEKVWDFIRAYGQSVAEKIKTRLGVIADEAPGNALVLQTEEDRIRAAFDRMFPHRGSLGSRRVTDPSAWAAGQRAGRNADIGDARVGTGATRAIG